MNSNELLKLRIPNAIYRLGQLLEILVSLLVVAAIALSLRSVVHSLGLVAAESTDISRFQEFLTTAFTVVIGIEFLKMLSRHSMSTVVDILLFAVARQMVIEHTTPLQNLIMIMAIGLLFLIRKYLFIPELDSRPSIIFGPHPGREKEPAADQAEKSAAGSPKN